MNAVVDISIPMFYWLNVCSDAVLCGCPFKIVLENFHNFSAHNQN
jgi:hypothetical protein